MTFADEKYLSLATLMTDMSEDLISESDIRGGVVLSRKPKRTGRFSAFMNHPAMVAVLCAVVSLGVVAAIVLAGRGGPGTPPWTETTPSGRPPVYSEDVSYANVYVTYIHQAKEIAMIPTRFMMWDETYDADGNLVCGEGSGFNGNDDQLAELKMVTDATNFTVYLKEKRELQHISIYDGAMNEIADLSQGQTSKPLAAGTYYVSLRIVTRDGELSDGHDYTFSLTLTQAVASLKISLRQENETALGYEATEYADGYTLTAQEPMVGANVRYFDILMTANEPGKILNACIAYQLYRLEGDEEVLVYDYDVGAVYMEYPKGPDDYATFKTGISFVYIRQVLEERGETLKTGTYRVKYGGQSVDFKLYDASHDGPVENPLLEKPMPVYLTITTLDGVMTQRYDRDYHETKKMVAIMDALASMIVENTPAGDMEPNEGLTIHVTFEDHTQAVICLRGDGYLYVDESPLFRVSKAEMDAFKELVKNTPD